MKPDLLPEYDRGMLRAMLSSVLWDAIQRQRDFNLAKLAAALQLPPEEVREWFSGEPPNWTADTIADIGRVLGLKFMFAASPAAGGADD